MFKGFRDFILRGNVLDLAVAVIIGGAFGAVVTSLVKDVLTPLIGDLVGKPDFSAIAYNHVMIGNFLNAIISFLMVALAVYFFIVAAGECADGEVQEACSGCASGDQGLPECLSDIPVAAKRCAHCAQPVA